MRRGIALTLVALVTLAGCELKPPFERPNPFDPGSPYPMRMVGVPDTVSAIGQRFQAVIERDPPIDQATLSLQWVVTDPNDILVSVSELRHLFNGEYLATNTLTAQLKTLAVAARFNDAVVVGRNIVVGQLVDSLRLACGSVSVPVACNAVPLAVGGSLSVRSRMRDALGSAIQGAQFAMQRAVVTLRTPGVISAAYSPNTQGTYTFSAIGAGSTWIVIRSDRAVDSVQVTVAP